MGGEGNVFRPEWAVAAAALCSGFCVAATTQRRCVAKPCTTALSARHARACTRGACALEQVERRRVFNYARTQACCSWSLHEAGSFGIVLVALRPPPRLAREDAELQHSTGHSLGHLAFR